MLRGTSRRDAFVLAGGAAAIGLIAVLLRRIPDISPTTAAMALLLMVLGAATLARLGVAIAIAVVAMLSLNFFFLPPRRHLHDRRPAELGRALSPFSSSRLSPAICRRRRRTAPRGRSPAVMKSRVCSTSLVTCC